MSGGSPTELRKQLRHTLPPLEAETEAALRSSIARDGIIVPVVHDQHGRTLDGHHRERIAAELGVPVPVETIEVRDDEHALSLAVDLNLARRQLSPEDRRRVVASLRAEGHSTRAIADVVGVSHKTVWMDEQDRAVTRVTAARVKGRDGKSYPSHRRRGRKPKPPREERPLVVRFAETIGAMSQLLEQPDALKAAIPPEEREQWASHLRGLARLAAEAADRLTADAVNKEKS